ncbi:unnamed protein product [Ectocarpus sp. CCAP 1310/34]|nr:unnamed protein product [Ectocarpus sp. CCAP 1310/34]
MTKIQRQGLLLIMVLVQNSSPVSTALGEKFPVVEPGEGRRDEGPTAATTTTVGRDFHPSQNRLRREEYPPSQGSRKRHQRLRAEQERTPYAQVSPRNHRNMQGWGREHRKLEGITEMLPHTDPQLSVEPEMLEDGNHSLRQISRALKNPPTNGSCPVAAHNSNSAVLREDRLHAKTSTVIFGTSNVWARLQQAATISSQQRCPSPPCCLGTHVHTYRGGDLGEEMSHVQGAVVVRRPDLAQAPVSLAPAHDVDFDKTFQSYFPISQNSLLRRIVEADEFNLTSTTHHVEPAFAELFVATNFFGAVRDGNPAAAEGYADGALAALSASYDPNEKLTHDVTFFVGNCNTGARLLTPYCSGEEPKQDIEECVRIPTLVSMANVYTNKKGAVWNENVRKSTLRGGNVDRRRRVGRGVSIEVVLVVRNNLRGLRNNNEVKEALKTNFPSFSVVEFFGTGSVRDQLKTFATAAMIIAPHGAGLANMIVAPLHTPVLEIGALACPACFLRLALKVPIGHRDMVCVAGVRG